MSKQQLHKRLTLEQVTAILEHYLAKEISLANALENLGVKKVRFCGPWRKMSRQKIIGNAHPRPACVLQVFLTDYWLF